MSLLGAQGSQMTEFSRYSDRKVGTCWGVGAWQPRAGWMLCTHLAEISSCGCLGLNQLSTSAISLWSSAGRNGIEKRARFNRQTLNQACPHTLKGKRKQPRCALSCRLPSRLFHCLVPVTLDLHSTWERPLLFQNGK